MTRNRHASASLDPATAERFGIPLWYPALLAGLPLCLLVPMARSTRERLVALAYGLAVAGLASVAAHLVVHPEGVRLSRVIRLRWDEVAEARVVRRLGLRHLHLTRVRGRDLWLPLYFRGARPIEHALLQWVPAEHPVARALAHERTSPA